MQRSWKKAGSNDILISHNNNVEATEFGRKKLKNIKIGIYLKVIKNIKI